MTTFRPNGNNAYNKNTIYGTTIYDQQNKSGSPDVLHKKIAGSNIMCAAPTTLDAGDVTSMGPIKNWQYRINTAQIPSYQADPLESYNFLKDAGYCLPVGNRIDFYRNNWIAYQNLTIPETDPIRYPSGLDTRGVQTNVTFRTDNSTGAPSNYELFMCLATTRTLEIGSGLQIEVNE